MLTLPLLLGAACGPAAVDIGQGASEDVTTAAAASGEGTTTVSGIDPAPWMAGTYSDTTLRAGSSHGLGFHDDVRHFVFEAGGGFIERRFIYEHLLDREVVRIWEPISEAVVRVFPGADDSERILWWEIEIGVDELGCQRAVMTIVREDGEEDAEHGTPMWPGAACAAEDAEQIPDARETYHLEWCDTPPPGCDAEGCECQRD